MSKTFLDKLADPDKRKEIGAFCPSSPFLAEKMVQQKELQDARVILELGAGDGVFTKRILEFAHSDAQIFIVEKDPELYAELLEKFPEHSANIYLMDVLDLPALLESKDIDAVDIIISGLPFINLPKELFVGVMTDVFGRFATDETLFKQFTYIAPSLDDIKRNLSKYRKYAKKILRLERVLLNVPPAFVITCKGYEKKVGHVLGLPPANTLPGRIQRMKDGIQRVRDKLKPRD